MIDIVAGQEAERRLLHEHASHMHPQSFVDGAEWYAAGMAVCAFLEDLARIYDEERCLHGRPRPGPGIRLHEACIDCWNELPF